MKESFSYLIPLALVLISTNAQVYNDPPVPGRYSGLTTGSNATGINFEVFYDLVCDSTYEEYQIF